MQTLALKPSRTMRHLPPRTARVQPKLKIGAVHDAAEMEADRVADQIMLMPSAGLVSNAPNAPGAPTAPGSPGGGKVGRTPSIINRKCKTCDDEKVQRKPAQSSNFTPPVIRMKGSNGSSGNVGGSIGGSAASPASETAINGLGAGRPLPAAERAFFEPRFGRDLSAVRIHTDTAADKASRTINARAFTLGNDIAFAKGEYSAGTPSSRHLMAHELTHTMQGGESIRRKCKITPALCNNADKAKIEKEILSNKTNTTKAALKYFSTTGKCYRPKDMGESLKLSGSVNYNATNTEYGKEVIRLNAITPTKIGIGDCIAFPVFWESPEYKIRQERTNCADRIAKFRKNESTKKYTEWKSAKAIKLAKGTDNYTKVIERTVKGNNILKEKLYGKGSLAVYAEEVKKINNPSLKTLKPGDCVALPYGWKDPNIGTLPKKPGSEAISGHAAHAIATVYAEQTGSTAIAKLQQKYIWDAIRIRIGNAHFPPNITSVVTVKVFHSASLKNSRYTLAIKELKKNAPTVAGVKNAKQVVLDNWSSKIPGDAGAYYFHWWKDSTPNRDFIALRKKGVSAVKAEKTAAYNWGTGNKVGAKKSDNKAVDGWLKKIKTASGTNGKIGAMYIYK